MGGYFSRFQSDVFANYEKSMQRIKSEADRLRQQKYVRKKRLDAISSKILLWASLLFGAALAYAAWVLRQPPGSYTALGHFLRVSPVVFEPILAYFAHDVVKWIASWGARRDEARIKALDTKLRSIVSELKDSTRYQKTQKLLDLYDPDAAAARAAAARRMPAASPAMPLGPPGAQRPTAQTSSSGGTSSQLQIHRRVTGAGLSLLPALDKLATSLIGDNPALTEGLREARSEAEALRERLAAAERRVAELVDENTSLRHRLGEEPESTSATPRATSDRAGGW
ncbi:hypothetical protein WJX72_008203 [[Myrmecia] bisecta]|uniref:Uncharacterized protein n=1 Tax=[Myrmecia] bisecta TaxID=41462 RepID=A0AAW1QFP7_9CHLO